MIFILNNQPTVANKYIADLRNVDVQKDRARFRLNLKRIGMLLGYELSKTLEYQEAQVETPLGIAETALHDNNIVLATILRAGLPMYNGLLEVFDEANSGFATAYRKHHKDGTFEINMPYITCPSLDEKVLILVDPMLATGASIDSCLQAFMDYGKPAKIHIVTAISSQFGIDYIRRHYPKVNLWVGAIDEELTAKSYIVPGLGDAGDLAFGPKVQE